MNPAEKIQAAIDKLEALKAASQGEYWYRSIGGISAYGGEFGVEAEGIAWTRDGERSIGLPQMTSTDAELVVTLHRTIDAQLAILEQGVRYMTAGIRFGAIETTALALAEAILGDSDA